MVKQIGSRSDQIHEFGLITLRISSAQTPQQISFLNAAAYQLV